MLTQLQLRRRGRTRYALMDGPLSIGWINDGIIGFGGLADRSEAFAAGVSAVAIVTHAAGTRRAPSLTSFPHSVSDADAVRSGEIVAGRVLAPEAVDVDLGGHGFEIAVPTETWLAMKLELAQRIHRGLAGSRVSGRPDDVAVPA